MFRFLSLFLALGLIFGGALGASALEVDSGDVYCFSSTDFAQTEEPLTGVCITELSGDGVMLLGQRVLRPGDILTAQQLEQLIFVPAGTEEDAAATVSYLPIYENRVEKSASVTIAIRGREDKAPVAEDSNLETYRDMSNESRLKVTDPEGQNMTYTVVRQPRRGTVEIRSDGSFTYTPKKSKVGVDSFTYTATDPAGKVSREATVTIRILKPEQAAQYTDTVGLECQFEAEWLKNQGIFTAEQMGGSFCFQPEKEVSRGQFLAMMTQLLELDVEEQPLYTELAASAPQWLRPYLAAAIRSGIAANWQPEDMDAPITGGEAALILQNAMDLPVAAQTMTDEEWTWEQLALAAMNENGLTLDADQVMTRAETAQLLYQVSRMTLEAPGLAAMKY
jgi:hypothetical protein